MFIRTTKAKNKEYISLVESFWEDGRSKQRVLYNFGRADLIRRDESFLNVVKRLCEIAKIPVEGTEKRNKSALFEDCSEATLYNYGYLAYLHLWRELGIDGCIEETQHGTKLTFSLPETVFLMVIQHLLDPMSKYSTHANHSRYFNMPEIQLHHLYRALDKLCERKEGIELGLFQYNYIRLNKSVEIVFYDVTTVHFESTLADELREFGYSKNCKFNEVQVVLAMIIDEHGIPVGYELYKGNTFEGKTIVETLEKIKKRFRISRVIIVADRGMCRKLNLKLIKDAGYDYIVGTKIKGSSVAFQKKVLADNDFEDIYDKNGNLLLRHKLIERQNVYIDENKKRHTLMENIAVSYSPKRAKKDKADRDRLVEKAENLLKNPESISSTNKRGGRKYINQSNPAKASDEDAVEYSLARDKIEHDAKFDGYYAIQTSKKSLSAPEIMDAYHMLWKIEECFRVMKSTLEIRPVYHWTPNRIRGHFVVCFLAFLMERKMELLLKKDLQSDECDESNASCSKIQDALNTLQLAAVSTEQGEMFIKVKPHPLASKIFKRLNIKMPANISTKNDLIAQFQLDTEPEPIQMSFF